MQQLVGKTSHLPAQNSGKLICCVGPGHKLFVAAQHEPNCCYGPECKCADAVVYPGSEMKSVYD